MWLFILFPDVGCRYPLCPNLSLYLETELIDFHPTFLTNSGLSTGILFPNLHINSGPWTKRLSYISSRLRPFCAWPRGHSLFKSKTHVEAENDTPPFPHTKILSESKYIKQKHRKWFTYTHPDMHDIIIGYSWMPSQPSRHANEKVRDSYQNIPWKRTISMTGGVRTFAGLKKEDPFWGLTLPGLRYSWENKFRP